MLKSTLVCRTTKRQQTATEKQKKQEHTSSGMALIMCVCELLLVALEVCFKIAFRISLASPSCRRAIVLRVSGGILLGGQEIRLHGHVECFCITVPAYHYLLTLKASAESVRGAIIENELNVIAYLLASLSEDAGECLKKGIKSRNNC